MQKCISKELKLLEEGLMDSLEWDEKGFLIPSQFNRGIEEKLAMLDNYITCGYIEDLESMLK